jgi:hypothetical protein
MLRCARGLFLVVIGVLFSRRLSVLALGFLTSVYASGQDLGAETLDPAYTEIRLTQLQLHCQLLARDGLACHFVLEEPAFPEVPGTGGNRSIVPRPDPASPSSEITVQDLPKTGAALRVNAGDIGFPDFNINFDLRATRLRDNLIRWEGFSPEPDFCMVKNIGLGLQTVLVRGIGGNVCTSVTQSASPEDHDGLRFYKLLSFADDPACNVADSAVRAALNADPAADEDAISDPHANRNFLLVRARLAAPQAREITDFNAQVARDPSQTVLFPSAERCRTYAGLPSGQENIFASVPAVQAAAGRTRVVDHLSAATAGLHLVNTNICQEPVNSLEFRPTRTINGSLVVEEPTAAGATADELSERSSASHSASARLTSSASSGVAFTPATLPLTLTSGSISTIPFRLAFGSVDGDRNFTGSIDIRAESEAFDRPALARLHITTTDNLAMCQPPRGGHDYPSQSSYNMGDPPEIPQNLKAQLPPAGSTILLPEQAFNGGVLTGVVIAPDDQPVANAPVQIAGGVPGTLSGVVWGDGTQPSAPRTDSSKLPLPYIRCADNNADTANSRAAAAGGGGTGVTDLTAFNGTGGIAVNDRAAAAGGGGTGLTANGVGGSPIGKNTPFGQVRNLVTTDGNGRFAVCVASNASTVGVSIPQPGNGSPLSKTVPLAADIPTPQPPFPHTPDFVQPDQRFSMPGIFPKAQFEQGGNQGSVPVATAISPNGKQSISTFKAPHNLQSGPVKWTLTDQNGQQTSYNGGIFKIIRASIDSSKLHSNQGADFEYEVLADAQSLPAGLCVDVKLVGPITMLQAPKARVSLDGSGHGKFGGKIRAAQVAPGSAVPFDIQPNFYSCRK